MRLSDSSAGRILIADDQPDVLEALRLLLKGEGFLTETKTSPQDVLAELEVSEFDALLIDLNYARLLSILRTQVELGRALRKGERLEAAHRLLRAEGRPILIAESPAMQPVVQMISRLGPSDANVLITGEHGTGKEVVAQTLHALSNRESRPMVTVNAGGLSEGLFESELFGHVKGAFTDAKIDRVGRFEMADGGTLFLDEIANVPLNLQAKLLRALEVGEIERVGSSKTKRVDVRVISATNARL